jgi:hypothetical protein
MRGSVSAPLVQRSWVNTTLYLGTTVVSALLGLASAVLMTHLLDPHEYASASSSACSTLLPRWYRWRQRG